MLIMKEGGLRREQEVTDRPIVLGQQDKVPLSFSRLRAIQLARSDGLLAMAGSFQSLVKWPKEHMGSNKRLLHVSKPLGFALGFSRDHIFYPPTCNSLMRRRPNSQTCLPIRNQMSTLLLYNSAVNQQYYTSRHICTTHFLHLINKPLNIFFLISPSCGFMFDILQP